MDPEEPAGEGAAAASQESSRLARVMAATRMTMQAQFAELRAGFTHSVPKGVGGETLVAKFLQRHLPEQIGVAAGQVIDSNGAISKQVDVVLYDRARTPMLFTSSNGHDSLIPVEGVLAVIEVKTHLKKAMLVEILENCRSVKQLNRSAYFDRPGRATYRVYDRDWVDFPIYYSIFANKTDNMYAGALNDLQHDSALHERIDSVCYLDRGANLNVSVDSAAVTTPQISATSTSGSGLIDIESDNALLHWYGALASIVAQVEVRPINILAYMGSEIRISGRVPAGRFTEELAARLRSEVAAATNVNPDTLVRFQEKTITERDAYDLLRSPGFYPESEVEAELAAVREAARTLPFEIWRTHWNITGTHDE